MLCIGTGEGWFLDDSRPQCKAIERKWQALSTPCMQMQATPRHWPGPQLQAFRARGCSCPPANQCNAVQDVRETKQRGATGTGKAEEKKSRDQPALSLSLPKT